MNISIKSFFISIFLCLFFFGCCNNKVLNLETKINGFEASFKVFQEASSPLSNKQIVENSLNSTVALTKLNEEGKKHFYCSGVFVDPTTIVTARHCVVDSGKIRLLNHLFGEDFSQEFLDDLLSETLNKTVLITTRSSYINSSHGNDLILLITAKVKYITMKNVGKINDVEADDIAILKVEQKDASRYYINVSMNEPSLGDKIFSSGMPLGEPWLLAEGIISQNHYIGRTKTHYYVNMYVAPGASGGPLINARGELIGIAHVMLSGASETHSGMGLYVGLNKIKQYLNYAKDLNYD